MICYLALLLCPAPLPPPPPPVRSATSAPAYELSSGGGSCRTCRLARSALTCRAHGVQGDVQVGLSDFAGRLRQKAALPPRDMRL